MNTGKKQGIAAGIVLYEPDPDRLSACLDRLSPSVSRIYIVDNASACREEIRRLLRGYEKVRLQINERNLGIASALNEIFSRADKDGFDWVLTLDGDSLIGEDLAGRLFEYASPADVGIVCPVAVHDEEGLPPEGERVPGMRPVRSCITAGSLTRVRAFKACGGFDGKMFIDFVDIDFCLTLKEHGYRIIQRTDVFILQRYGAVSKKIRLGPVCLYRFNYSPQRVYTSVRNQIYLIRKHRDPGRRISAGAFLLGYILKRLLFEGERIKSLQAVLRGGFDGITMPTD